MTLLSDLGPFFAVETHAPGASCSGPWRPLGEVLDDGPALRARVEEVRAALGVSVELRVAASVTHLGLAARLWSPALALAAGSGTIPDYADAWWQPKLGGAVPLSLTDATAETLASFVDGPLSRLDAAMAEFSVSSPIRRGNVASALNGAATMLLTSRPEWTPRVRELVAEAESLPYLEGTATRENGRFRRRSCCLIYRAAPDRDGPKCGDCVLT